MPKTRPKIYTSNQIRGYMARIRTALNAPVLTGGDEVELDRKTAEAVIEILKQTIIAQEGLLVE
jgi:hypothetical protein